MAAREFATVFHNRAQFRRKFLDELGWSPEDFSEFQENLKAEAYPPEALFLDLFSNGFNGTPDMNQTYRSLVWWRERAPKLARPQWFLAAVGYAKALAAKSAPEVLLVDFWERELDTENLAEALYLSREFANKGKISIQWVCWSHSLLESWQQEGMGEASAREERLSSYFRAQGMEPVFVPVTDPLGSLVAAKRMAGGEKLGAHVVVMPSFGNDKLVHANWYMKTVARFGAAMEGREQ